MTQATNAPAVTSKLMQNPGQACGTPYRQLVARVDRGYRGRNGLITLVELKTRRRDRYLSEVIALSAQRVALAGETGEPVAVSDGLSWSRKPAEGPIGSL